MAAGSNLLVVLAGISGSGKSFLTTALAQERNFTVIPSMTTRSPRVAEAGSADRKFCSLPEFEKLLEQNRVICSRFFFGNWYGLDIGTIDAGRRQGNAVVQLTYKSVSKFRARYPDAKAIYIVPPSADLAKETVIARQLGPVETAERLHEIDDEWAFADADRRGSAPLFDEYFDNTRDQGTLPRFFALVDVLRS